MQRLLDRIPYEVGMIAGSFVLLGILMDSMLMRFDNAWFIVLTVVVAAVSLIVASYSLYQSGIVHRLLAFIAEGRIPTVSDDGLRGIVRASQLRMIRDVYFYTPTRKFWSPLMIINLSVVAVAGILMLGGATLIGITAILAILIADCFVNDGIRQV